MTQLSLCAPQVLASLCKIAWLGLAAQVRGLMVLMMGVHLLGHCAKCFVGTFLVRTITYKVRTIIFCFPSKKAEIRQVN